MVTEALDNLEVAMISENWMSTLRSVSQMGSIEKDDPIPQQSTRSRIVVT